MSGANSYVLLTKNEKTVLNAASPAPHGAGGLKQINKYKIAENCKNDKPLESDTECPAPHGAGGLKSFS